MMKFMVVEVREVTVEDFEVVYTDLMANIGELVTEEHPELAGIAIEKAKAKLNKLKTITSSLVVKDKDEFSYVEGKFAKAVTRFILAANMKGYRVCF